MVCVRMQNVFDDTFCFVLNNTGRSCRREEALTSPYATFAFVECNCVLKRCSMTARGDGIKRSCHAWPIAVPQSACGHVG
jgi:hypothetical protein